MSGHVVEFLTFDVDDADHAAWIAADAEHWTAFLRAQPGFVSKQVWADRAQPDRICAVIVWDDEAAWKAIPTDQLSAVDAAMGQWRREPLERVFDVVADTLDD